MDCYKVLLINSLNLLNFIAINNSITYKIVPIFAESTVAEVSPPYANTATGTLTLNKAIPDSVWNSANALISITTSAGIGGASRQTQFTQCTNGSCDTIVNVTMVKNTSPPGQNFYACCHTISSTTTVDYMINGLLASGSAGNALVGKQSAKFMTKCWVKFAIVFD